MVQTTVRPVLVMRRVARMTMAAARASSPEVGSLRGRQGCWEDQSALTPANAGEGTVCILINDDVQLAVHCQVPISPPLPAGAKRGRPDQGKPDWTTG